MNLQGTNMNYLGIRYSDVHFSPFTKHLILDAYHNPEHNDTLTQRETFGHLLFLLIHYLRRAYGRTVFPLNNFKKHCSLKSYKMLHTKCTWNDNTRLRKHQLNLYFYFTNHPSYPNLRNDIHFKLSKIEFGVCVVICV